MAIMNRGDKKIIIDCDCGENRFIRFWKFDDEDFWSVCLSYRKWSWFRRIKYAIKVIIKDEDWDEILISDGEMKRLTKEVNKDGNKIKIRKSTWIRKRIRKRLGKEIRR